MNSQPMAPTCTWSCILMLPPPLRSANPIGILMTSIILILQRYSPLFIWLTFAERNVLGKPMSRAIQNDIQNIQKMLDKDIEDSSLSGKTSSSVLVPITHLVIQSPPTCQNFA